MRATAEPLEGNLVRLSVEIDEPEFDRALGDVVRSLARSARVPGFRPGKVPRRVLEARMGGATALRAEALRESLPDFYARAIVDTELDPIAQPEIDITGGEAGGSVSFDAVVQVRPSVSIPGYDGLQVTLPGLAVTDEDVQRQLDRLRENDAVLEVVERPAIDGDQVTIDLHGNDPLGAEVVGVDDYLYEVGSGTVVEALDGQLHGAKAGAILAFDAPNPNDPDESIAFRVLVKEVKIKKLPEATDEWAAESSEFATLAELRADIASRIRSVKLMQAQMALRQKSIEALAGLVPQEDVPDVLVDAEVNERLHDLQHRLEAQKLGLTEYFQAMGTSPDELLGSLRTEAESAVKADLALRALMEAEELTLADEELDGEIASMAERMGTSPKELRRQLDTAGRTGAVRSELRKSKALEWLLDHVDLVDEEGNPVDREDLKADASGEDAVSDNDAEGGNTVQSETAQGEIGQGDTDVADAQQADATDVDQVDDVEQGDVEQVEESE